VALKSVRIVPMLRKTRARRDSPLSSNEVPAMERRDSLRVRPGGVVTLRMNGRTYTAPLLNLGQGGALVDTSEIDERFFQGEELEVTVSFVGLEPVSCDAEVRWSVPESRVAGLRFLGLNAAQRATLVGWVSGFVSAGGRVAA
jgi:hypothetical protein